MPFRGLTYVYLGQNNLLHVYVEDKDMFVQHHYDLLSFRLDISSSFIVVRKHTNQTYHQTYMIERRFSTDDMGGGAVAVDDIDYDETKDFELVLKVLEMLSLYSLFVFFRFKCFVFNYE